MHKLRISLGALGILVFVLPFLQARADATFNISGQVFEDVAGNGQTAISNPGLAGWRVYLDLNHNGSFESSEPSAITDASGNFTISGVQPGAYDLREIQQQGWIQTLPDFTQNFITPIVILNASISNILLGNHQINSNNTSSGSGSGSGSLSVSIPPAPAASPGGGQVSPVGSVGTASSPTPQPTPVSGGTNGGGGTAPLSVGAPATAGVSTGTPTTPPTPTGLGGAVPEQPQVLGAFTALPRTGISETAIYGIIIGFLIMVIIALASYLPIKKSLKLIIYTAVFAVALFVLLDWNFFSSYFSSKQIPQQNSTAISADLAQAPEIPKTLRTPANTLLIPSLGLEAPINYPSETSDNSFQLALQKGVVHFPNTALPGNPGNIYIFGHSSDFIWAAGSYKNIFARLPDLKLGDLIIASNPAGQAYSYSVIKKEIVSPSDTSVLKQDLSSNILTLQTSYPLGTALKRYIVIARLSADNGNPSNTTSAYQDISFQNQLGIK